MFHNVCKFFFQKKTQNTKFTQVKLQYLSLSFNKKDVDTLC